MPGKSQSRERTQVVRKKAKKVPVEEWVKQSQRYQQTAESMLVDVRSQVPCPERSDRFHPISMRRAIEPFKIGTPRLTSQQSFWRTAGARFLVAESAHSSALGDADLESELGIANAEGRDLKKYVADFEDDPVMTPRMLSLSSRRAYLRGWLPDLTSGWLFDDGALLVALSVGDMVPVPGSDAACTKQDAAAAHVKWNDSYNKRVKIAKKKLHAFCNHARAAYKAMIEPSDLAPCGARQHLVGVGVGDNAAERSTVALRALKKLERDLTDTRGGMDLVRWSALDPSLTDQIDVGGDLLSEPDLEFLRDVRRAIACLSTRPRQSIRFKSAMTLARSIWYLHVGIAWVDALYDREQNKLLVEFRPEPLDIDKDTKWVSPCLTELPVAKNRSST